MEPNPSTQGAQSLERHARALLHRWLVEYNPLALMSAALVLSGLWVLSREVASHRSLQAQLALSGIAELYALVLILGAALLIRIREPRAAAMLALLAALYQGDLSMHVERSAWLPGIGVLGATSWLALFVAKLAGLQWALRLRLSVSATATVLLGALSVAGMPIALQLVDRAAGGFVVATALSAVGLLALWAPRTVRISGARDVRAVRAIRATWIGWGVLLVAHALYWALEHHLDVSSVLVPLLILSLRFVKRPAALTLLQAAALGLVSLLSPSWLSFASAISAALLTLRMWRSPVVTRPVHAVPQGEPPYRADVRPHCAVVPGWKWDRPSPSMQLGLLSGAMGCAYLAMWTMRWHGGPFPAHIAVLDVLVVAGATVAAWRLRAWRPVLPAVAVLIDLAVRHGGLRLPATGAEWGWALTGAGFVAMFASLGLSFRWRTRPEPSELGPAQTAPDVRAP